MGGPVSASVEFTFEFQFEFSFRDLDLMTAFYASTELYIDSITLVIISDFGCNYYYHMCVCVLLVS